MMVDNSNNNISDDDDDDDVAVQQQQQQQQHNNNNPSVRVWLSQRRTTVRPMESPVDQISFLCGFLAGVAQAGVFNPYDRALYLSITNHRPFLSLKNWTNPYSGFLQSIGGRALSGGLYFPLEHLFLRIMNRHNYENSRRHRHGHYVRSESWNNFVVGIGAGAVNACIINPLSAVRYKTWSREVNRGMWKEMSGMWSKSGFSFRPFLNGLVPTLYRDMVFGACYTSLRLQLAETLELEPHRQYLANMLAATVATVASGPFNYARIMQYNTSSERPADKTFQILNELVRETCDNKNNRAFADKCRFLQQRLRLGWATARVAVGMAFGHATYDWLHEYLAS